MLRDLAASRIGQQLLAAGQVSAIRALLSSSPAGVLGPNPPAGAGPRDDLEAILAAADVERLGRAALAPHAQNSVLGQPAPALDGTARGRRWSPETMTWSVTPG